MAFSPAINASPLILLTRAGLLDLLQSVSQEVVVPAGVATEIQQYGVRGVTLTGQASNMNASSYVNYRTLEALVKTVSRSSSWLLPSLESDALKIPDCLTCIGPFWMEDWGERKAEERFSFEGWRADVQEGSSHLLGLLRQIYEDTGFPTKLKHPAKELHRLLIREKDESVREYSTLQAMKTENIVVSLPFDYPHFWREQLEEDARQQVLEEPDTWKSALLASFDTSRFSNACGAPVSGVSLGCCHRSSNICTVGNHFQQ